MSKSVKRSKHEYDDDQYNENHYKRLRQDRRNQKRMKNQLRSKSFDYRSYEEPDN